MNLLRNWVVLPYIPINSFEKKYIKENKNNKLSIKHSMRLRTILEEQQMKQEKISHIMLKL
jgi:hypothetical protein